MSISLLKLTCVNGDPFYVNPLNISLFTPSTEDFCRSIGAPAARVCQGATVVMIGGIPFQFRDSCQDIISGIIALRDQQNQATLKLLRNRQKEDWELDDEDEYDDED